MSDPRNVAHDKKVIHEKLKQGQEPAEVVHLLHPGKKTAREKPHGAHTETEAEEAGGNVTDSQP